MTTSYTVKLNVFEGPLDLLLHLISKAEVDIKDISIADITEQYLEYLDDMKKFDMEIASEFLVMASTLVYIKSRSLVPEKRDSKREEDDYDGIDSQEELIQKLIEYKQYKKIGEKLQTREEVYNNIYNKVAEDVMFSEIEGELLYGLTKEDLLSAFKKVTLSKANNDKNKEQEHIIKRDNFTLEERTRQLNRLLDQNGSLNFFDLFYDDYEKMDVVITFLALLEMIKKRKIKLYQKRPFEDIIIRKRG